MSDTTAKPGMTEESVEMIELEELVRDQDEARLDKQERKAPETPDRPG